MIQNETRTPSCICRADVTVERIRPKLVSGASFAAAPAKAMQRRDAEVGAVEQVEHLEPQIGRGPPAEPRRA